MARHRVDGDEAMNPALREQIQTLRGSIVGQIQKKFAGQPDWLEAFPCEGEPAFVLRDKRTGRQVEVGLCDLHGALDVLRAFFGERGADE